MNTPPLVNIILMGPRASGKSTIGGALAAKLSWPMVDLDNRTAALLGEHRAGDALSRHGEPAFREAEGRALAVVLQGRGQVISLGGGTPMGTAARALLETCRIGDRTRTPIIYLHVDATILKRRIAADPTPRPSLTGRSAIDEVEAVLSIREPVYRSLAHHVVEASEGTPDTIADRVLARIACE